MQWHTGEPESWLHTRSRAQSRISVPTEPTLAHSLTQETHQTQDRQTRGRRCAGTAINFPLKTRRHDNAGTREQGTRDRNALLRRTSLFSPSFRSLFYAFIVFLSALPVSSLPPQMRASLLFHGSAVFHSRRKRSYSSSPSFLLLQRRRTRSCNQRPGRRQADDTLLTQSSVKNKTPHIRKDQRQKEISCMNRSADVCVCVLRSLLSGTGIRFSLFLVIRRTSHHVSDCLLSPRSLFS